MRKKLFYLLAALLGLAAAWIVSAPASFGQSINLSTPLHYRAEFDPKQPMITIQPSATQTGDIIQGLSSAGLIGFRLTPSGNFVFGAPYFNFGSVEGISGYGFRNNAGVVQYKNSGGDWANVGSGGPGGTGLGNGTTVFDPTSLPLLGMTSQFLSAISLIPAAGGKITLEGYLTGNTLTSSPTCPINGAIVLPTGLTYMAAGVSIIGNYGCRLTGDTLLGSHLARSTAAITAGDLSPIVFLPRNTSRMEIDHLNLGGATPGGTGMTVSSVAAHSTTAFAGIVTDVTDAGLGIAPYLTHKWTYHFSTGVFAAASQNQDIMENVTMSGLTGGNNGNLTCLSWTTDSITCLNGSGAAESGATGTMTIATTVYTGTFTTTGWAPPLPTTCAANACAGYDVSVIGINSAPNVGYFPVVASTGATLTLANSLGAVDTSGGTTNCPAGSHCVVWYTASLVGGAAIAGQFGDTHIHDIYTAGVDRSIVCVTSCGSYNSFGNNNLRSYRGGLYLGHVLSGTIYGQNEFWAADQTTVGFAAGIGYGLWLHYAGWWDASNAVLDMENTKYSLLCTYCNKNHFGTMYVENSLKYDQNLAVLNTNPILTSGSYNNRFDFPIDVTDYSQNYSNIQGTGRVRQPVVQPMGSVSVAGIANPNLTNFATAYKCTGATLWAYQVVGVDANGNKTLPIESDLNNNATLGATACAGSTPAANRINAALAWSGNPLGIQSYDILKCIGDNTAGCPGGTWKSLATKVPYDPAQYWYDDGSGDAGAAAYTVPTRNSTADVSIGGQLTLAGGTQYSIPFFNPANIFTKLAAPTTVGFFHAGWVNPTAAATAPQVVQEGLNNRTASGATDTILYSDSGHAVECTYAGAQATALPTPTTLANSHFVTKIVADAGCTVTVTPTTWTIQGAATLVIPPLKSATIRVGAGTDWRVDMPAVVVASGTATINPSSIAANNCAAAIDVAATNVLATDVVQFTPNASIKAVVGFTPDGTITVVPYPAAGHIYFDVCNKDQSNAVDPGTFDVNYLVTR